MDSTVGRRFDAETSAIGFGELDTALLDRFERQETPVREAADRVRARQTDDALVVGANTKKLEPSKRGGSLEVDLPSY